MKQEQKHVTYLRLLPHLTAELEKHFNNDRYRKSRTYGRILDVTQNRDENRMQDIRAIEPELSVIIAFAKLRGLTTLEQLSRDMIRLF